MSCDLDLALYIEQSGWFCFLLSVRYLMPVGWLVPYCFLEEEIPDRFLFVRLIYTFIYCYLHGWMFAGMALSSKNPKILRGESITIRRNQNVLSYTHYKDPSSGQAQQVNNHPPKHPK